MSQEQIKTSPEPPKESLPTTQGHGAQGLRAVSSAATLLVFTLPQSLPVELSWLGQSYEIFYTLVSSSVKGNNNSPG